MKTLAYRKFKKKKVVFDPESIPAHECPRDAYEIDNLT